MKYRQLIPFVLFIFILSCSEEAPVAVDDDLVVVRGYVYAGEPVTDIQVTETLMLGVEDTIAPPINDADVVILKNDQRYVLIPSAGDNGYYHYDGDDLIIETGDQIGIEVKHKEQMAIGWTSVPDAPVKVSISKTTLMLPDRETMQELRQQGVSRDSLRKSMELMVEWEQAPEALYYVVIENIDANPTAIEINFRGPGPRRFISAPIPSDKYRVNAMMMTHYGDHVARVYRVNQEYADLYESRNQDSRDLNEPLTNISGGLGVFSGFNSTTVEFTFLEN